MSGFNERIKIVIQDSGLTKTCVAEKLNISQAYLSQLCSGVRDPSDRTISDICREFDISEAWLRTGEGEMRLPKSRDEEIADMVARAISGDNALKKAVIRMICSRTEAELVLLEKMLWQIVEALEKNKGQTEV